MPQYRVERENPPMRGAKVQSNFSLDGEARKILEACVPGRGYGDFVSRLLYEHRARTEERARLQEMAPKPE
jgi:hypothetical protein